MSQFVVYPAIDLRYGKVVRLRQGKGDQQTVYRDDPAEAAKEWILQGASWLHVVNLNGAFGEATAENESAIERIAAVGEGKINIQLGGGLRSMEQIGAAFNSGVSRVVLGTAVIEDPEFGEHVLEAFGGNRIAFGFDAVGQELKTQGWQAGAPVGMFALAERLAAAGAQTLIYTNILKDGMQTGVDLENTKRLADQTGLEVIASGGTNSLHDIAQVKAAGLGGVIVGRALYEGNFTLQEALDVR